jgi:hypothetical protein
MIKSYDIYFIWNGSSFPPALVSFPSVPGTRILSFSYLQLSTVVASLFLGPDTSIDILEAGDTS